jgi:hypothetical protein
MAAAISKRVSKPSLLSSYTQLSQNLMFQRTVAPRMVTCLYQADGYLNLQVYEGEGESWSIVNPKQAGFILWNMTSSKTILPRGVGKDFYFPLLCSDIYSLKLNGKEVWSHGEPDPFLLVETSEVRLISTFSGLS